MSENKKIDKLTDEQIAKFPVYVDKWVSVGLNTDRFTQEEAEAIIWPFQEKILGTERTPVVLVDNPIDAWKKVCYHVCSGDDAKELMKKYIWPHLNGSFSVSVFSYYDFLIQEGIVELEPELLEKFNIWMATTKLGLIYPLKDLCVVCQKPKGIYRNEAGQLHRDGGMALEYEGWGFWCLNNIAVPQYLAETPAEDLDIEFFKKERNADIKAEFVRKYGVERMLDLGKKIDDYTKYDQEEQPWWWSSEYELWDMASIFEGLEYQPYLKMRNQTTQIWHVEAVSPNCRNLADAIKERFGGKEMKIVKIV